MCIFLSHVLPSQFVGFEASHFHCFYLQTYAFNICGTSARRCLPKDYTSRYYTGEAMQFWGGNPLCDITDPTMRCVDPFTGNFTCCTAPCEVLGVGTPIWELADPNDPIFGGVLLKHNGVPPAAKDPNHCPINKNTGAEFDRSVTFVMHCDPFISPNTLQLLTAYENTTCSYVIEVNTVAACGCSPNCAGKMCGPDGCGGYCSGPALGGNCPYGQTCMPDNTCCRADCTSRDCGDDGCGGVCGACGSDETCTTARVCLSNLPFVPAPASVFAPNHSGLAGAFFGGSFAAVSCAGILWFLKYGGREAFDKWRFGGSGAGSQKVSLIHGSSTSAATASAPAGESVKPATASSSYSSYGT